MEEIEGRKIIKTDKPVQMYADSILHLSKSHDRIYQKCCECGCWHEILILSDHGGIDLKFTPLDEEPDFSAINVETTVSEVD